MITKLIEVLLSNKWNSYALFIFRHIFAICFENAKYKLKLHTRSKSIVSYSFYWSGGWIIASIASISKMSDLSFYLKNYTSQMSCFAFHYCRPCPCEDENLLSKPLREIGWLNRILQNIWNWCNNLFHFKQFIEKLQPI